MTETSVHPAVRPLVGAVVDLAAARERVVVGLVGPPGTGKSTVAALLVAALQARGTSTALVPMDGFHLDQQELERLGRADRKGAPDTFDPAGYVSLLRRLRERREPVTYGPRFDRDLEQSVGSALAVPADVQVVVTEGNYLLLDRSDLAGTPAGADPASAAWADVRPLLDRCWFVATDPGLRLQRLLARHVAHGRSPEAAREWVQRSDEANAALVDGTRHRADGVVAWD
ncbi:nucleoside/nucleotide kinase family protein [Aquipuribacter sp. MA13-6]|uniref:nucleoside/nucleotide kinase family protein n=1 Tax=unclassified Aquipuribacter TaxID=2635084 RepID=UPI003EEE9ABE